MDENRAIKELTVELRKVIDDVEHICLSCGTIVKAPIFGLYAVDSGALVNIMVEHAKPFTCKLCKKRIELLESKEKESQGSFLKLKEDHSLTSGIELVEALKKALGLK